VAPKLKLDSAGKPVADLATLRGVITHRYEIMARYTALMRRAVRDEMSRLRPTRQAGNEQCNWHLLKRARAWLHLSDDSLQPEQRAQIDQAVAQHQALSTLLQMRRELGRLWESSSASSEQLLHDLQAWCQRAQQSGIEGLEQFAYRLRRYAA